MNNIPRQDQNLLKREGAYRIAYWFFMLILSVALIEVIILISISVKRAGMDELSVKEHLDYIRELPLRLVAGMAVPFLIALLAESKLRHIKSIKYYMQKQNHNQAASGNPDMPCDRDT